MQISLPTDVDGYLSQECPSCEQRFKVLFGEGSEEPITFCPYCGHRGRDCWYTKDQVEYIQAVTANAVLGPVNSVNYGDSVFNSNHKIHRVKPVIFMFGDNI